MAKKTKKSTPPPVKGKSSPPPVKPAKTAAKKSFFAKPRDEERPPKIVVPAVEGWGKSTLASQIDNVALIMSDSERGYLTLEAFGRVKKVDCTIVDSWSGLNEVLDELADSDYDAVAIDELSGIESLCQDMVCAERFDNDWQKFIYYAKGAEQVKREFGLFLAKLEALNKMIVILSHCKIETFKDPANADYDRYTPDVDIKRTWPAIKRWADAILFGTFVSVVDEVKKGDDQKRKKGKGIGGAERVLYCERRDTHDAKNRFGMPSEIDMPDDPAVVWSTIWAHIIGTAEE